MATSTTNDNFSVYGIEFPTSGTLENHDGFLYVKIDDIVRQKIFDALKEQDPQMQENPSLKERASIPVPPCPGQKDVGAHVSIIEARERSLIDPATLEKFIREKVKTEILFDRVLGIRTLSETAFSQHLWILELESEQLEKLRENALGLSRRPNSGKFNFHISIADIPWQFSPQEKEKKDRSCVIQ